MQQRSSYRTSAQKFLLPWIGLGAAVLLSLAFGTSDISLPSMLESVLSSPWPPASMFLPGFLTAENSPSELPVAATIFWSVRVPRTLLVCCVGAVLSAAGVLSQGLFRNPLASPSILGIEAGAGFAGVLAMLTLPSLSHWYAVPASATLGALAVTVVILGFARSFEGVGSLLLVGVGLGAFLSAGTSFLIAIYSDDYARSAMVFRWLLGGFGGRGYEHLPMVLIPGVIGLILVRKTLTPLDLISLGEETATSLSVNVNTLRWRVILVMGLWLGGAIAVAGNVPFISLVVPHISRKLFGPRSSVLLYGSMILGVTLMLLADVFGRTIRAPGELEVGIVMGLVGAPIFLAILVRSFDGRRPYA